MQGIHDPHGVGDVCGGVGGVQVHQVHAAGLQAAQARRHL